jgi:hypothetical protein
MTRHPRSTDNLLQLTVAIRPNMYSTGAWSALMLAGSAVAWILGALDSAVVVGGLSALGVGL